MNPDISYLLRNIELLSLHINQRPPIGFTGNQFHFDITAEARVSPEKEVVFMVITINTREADKEEQLAQITTALAFQIENFKEVIKLNENNVFEIPTDFEVLVRTIAISTTRGIMFSHFKGTHLVKAILPIVPQLVTPSE